MTPENIRTKWHEANIHTQFEALVSIGFFLSEVAAQLSELNKQLAVDGLRSAENQAELIRAAVRIGQLLQERTTWK
jgi:hypothetical protein